MEAFLSLPWIKACYWAPVVLEKSSGVEKCYFNKNIILVWSQKVIKLRHVPSLKINANKVSGLPGLTTYFPGKWIELTFSQLPGYPMKCFRSFKCNLFSETVIDLWVNIYKLQKNISESPSSKRISGKTLPPHPPSQSWLFSSSRELILPVSALFC